MLNRMVELAEQSANGTYEDTVDRKNLQAEVEQLKSEIDRISKATNFNGINLLDGSLGITTDKSGAIATDQMESSLIFAKDSNFASTSSNIVDETKTKSEVTLGGTAGAGDNVTISFVVDGKAHELKLTDAKGSALTAENVEKTINGEEDAILSFGDDAATKEALAVLKENFTISDGGTGKLVIEAKEAGASGNIITNIATAKQGGGAAGATATGFTTTLGKDQGYKFTFNGASATKDETIIIGDTSIEINKDDTYELVLGKLQAAGIDASLTETGGNVDGVYVNQSSTMVKQSGVGIETSNDAVLLTADTASKAKFESTLAAGSAGDKVLTINYVDANGENQTKEINYTATGILATDVDAIAKAINNDEELKGLFTVTSDATSKLTFESNVAGEDAQRITGLSFDDTAVTQTVAVTDGEDAGTIISLTGTNGATLAATDNMKIGDTMTINGKTYEFTDGDAAVAKGNTAITIGTDFEDTLKNLQNALKKDGIEAKLTGTAENAKLEIADTVADVKGTNNGGLTLQIGDTSDDFNKLTVSIDAMDTENLSIDGVDISTQEGASEAVEVIKSAINQVSSTRGTLGAMQNRLEHTVNNLSVTNENITNAESRIRDTDMAKEMMAYTSKNILSQAAQSMLAQANQQPQQVLSLLQ